MEHPRSHISTLKPETKKQAWFSKEKQDEIGISYAKETKSKEENVFESLD